MMVRTVNDISTAFVATTAIASPMWIQYLEGISKWAEWTLPILGAVWLVVQIVYKIREYNRGTGRTGQEKDSTED